MCGKSRPRRRHLRGLLALHRRPRDERGQDLVEFALAFPLVLLLFLGIIEFSLIILSYNTISNAAREGARYGVVHPGKTVEVQAAARQFTTAVRCSEGTVKVSPTWPSGKVQVDVECHVPLMTQMLIQALGGSGTIWLRASASMQVE